MQYQRKKTIYLGMILLLFANCKKEKELDLFQYQQILVYTSINQLDGTNAFIRPEVTRGKQIAAIYLTPDDSFVPLNPPPSLDDIKLGKWTYIDRLFSLSSALKAGMPIVNVAASRNLKLFVREYSRKVSRIALDGKTTIFYGQTIRSVIEIDNYDASLGIDLPSIAARGQISKATQYFYFYKDGFYHPEIDIIISNVSGKVFNVENYSLYQETMTRMIGLLAKPETQFTVKIIDREVPIEDDIFLIEAPIIAFTLSKISNGDSCDKIKSKFLDNEDALFTINKIYSALNLECSNEKPSSEIKKKAKDYLQGLVISMR